MNDQELIELFALTFPFWDQMTQADRETFLRCVDQYTGKQYRYQ